MADTIKIFETVDELALYFASFLEARIRETPEDTTFSWVLSGGATPALIFRAVALNCRESVDWNKIKVFWGDERCVGPQDEESNFRMARENLLELLPIPWYNIFRIHGENDPAEEAVNYSELFARQVNSYMGIPNADLVTLGLGEDGHTASVFPGGADLFSSHQLFDVSEHPLTKQKRITACVKVINNAKTIIILAPGENKAGMVARILDEQTGWEQLPAAWVRPEKGEKIWLLDRKSASKLKSNTNNEKPID